MGVFVTFYVVRINVYEAKLRYLFCSNLHYYYSCIQFFQGSLSQKKIVKVIDDDIHNKLLEILKGSRKFVLAKFCGNVDKKIWRLISNKDFKAKDKFSIVTGQTKFRLVG